MKLFTSAAVVLAAAAVLLPMPAASSDSDVYHPSEEAANNQAEESPALSTQQNLRRRENVFNNNANVDIIIELEDDILRRRLNGIGQATAAERKAAAEVNKAAAAAAAKSMGVTARLTYGGAAFFGFAATVPPGKVTDIEADPRVANVEIDGIIQLDPREMLEVEDRRQLAPPPGKGPGGGGGDQPPQTIPWGIARVNGGSPYSGSGKAWVIDTGIDFEHPDLNVDVDNSISFVWKGTPDDQNGHGTHVAGTIAAINNNIGVIGVAPGATVVSVRVLDRRGSGSYSGVIGGVDYVASKCNSSDVANMSLGGGKSESVNNAVVKASRKCPFVVAAGNEETDAGTVSPASAEGEGSIVYAVSAFSYGDIWASFSNYGSVVDYAGPGVGINSTWKGGGYRSISGTSMAAPHIAGVVLAGPIPIKTDGTVNGDPDSSPDPIGVLE